MQAFVNQNSSFMRFAGFFVWENNLTMILNNPKAAEQELGLRSSAAKCCTHTMSHGKYQVLFWKSFSHCWFNSPQLYTEQVCLNTSTATPSVFIQQVSYNELPQPSKEAIGSLQKGIWSIHRNPIYNFAIMLSVHLDLAKAHFCLWEENCSQMLLSQLDYDKERKE